MNGTFSHQPVAFFQSRKDFYMRAVVQPRLYLLFPIALVIHLHVNELYALFFGKCRKRDTDHPFTPVRQ